MFFGAGNGVVALALAGCAQRHVTNMPAPARKMDAGMRDAVVWQYDVRVLPPGARDLSVEARFAPGGGDTLEVDEQAAPFVRDVVYATGERWIAAPGSGASWTVPCQRDGCHVRYRFALREAAERLADAETAIASGDVISAPPSTWLVHNQVDGGRYRLHVTAEAPSRFAIAIASASDGAADTFESTTNDLEGAGFAVFGPFERVPLEVGGARVDVVVAPLGLPLSSAEVGTWVRTAVSGIAAYLGKFPAPRTLVVVQAGHPGSPTRGVTLGDGGPAVLVRAGTDADSAAKTRDDWVMTHELLHVSMPSLTRDHSWLSEGMATYVEPIVRARQGLVTPEAFWHDVVEGVPQGLPEAGDQGIERTHTWGRTYWGGALFLLVADVAIREQTKNARSLDDALRGIVATGADVEDHWTIERFLEVGDRATGTRVLEDLYKAWAFAPQGVDLPALWQKLGVRIVARGQAGFDDTAPLAGIRQSITSASRVP